MTKLMTTPAVRRPNDAGFTLVELLVASTITMLVLGGAVTLTSQMQNSYRRQMEDNAAQQEGRYALDWIGRLIRGAGNNPFNKVVTPCPGAGTPIDAISFDPDADGIDNDIRLMTDSNPPDGQIGGTAGTCNQSNEDVTVSLDADNHALLFLDNNLGGGASIRTDQVISDLRFIYYDSNHNLTAVADDVVFVDTQITIQTRTLNPATGLPVTRTISSEIRVRSR